MQSLYPDRARGQARRSGLKGRSGDAMQPNGREADMRKLIVLVMAVLLVLSAMACGASDEDLQAEYDRGYAAGDAAAKTTTVAVAVGEWSVTVTPPVFNAGVVEITAANGGPADAHEVVIFRTTLPVAEMQEIAIANAEERGFLPEEGVPGVEFIGEIEEFEVGASSSGVFDLSPGRYVFLCNIVSADEIGADGHPEAHLLEGMHAEVFVVG